MNYVISCSSTCDLNNEHLQRREIVYIPFHYQMDGKPQLDDLGASLSMEDFYAAMDNGADTRTSQINEDEYVSYFEQYLKEGKDLLHVDLSSGISGTMNSARLAMETLKEKYPERKIYVVDSLAASSGFGLLVDEMADRRDEGMSIDELAKWTEENKLYVHHWFFSTDLKFYIKGGRISKTAGMFGQLLNICPLLNVDYLGRLIPRDKIRTKKKVIHEIVNRMEAHAQNGLDYSGKVYISQSNCYEDARAVADLVEARFPKLKGKVEIFWIGPTIGSHTGPGTVALFFMGDKRVD
ncbi:MAG: DegV family protein [Clostridia bacterium]|nr:DegV family protein [Clostridia bacterium]